MELLLDKDLIALEELESQLATLENLREEIQLNGLDQGRVLEVDSVLGDSKALEGYYMQSDRSQRLKVVLEAVSEGVIAIAVAFLVALAAVIMKMMSWLRGSSDGGKFSGNSKQLSALHNVMDSDVERAMRDADVAHHQRRHGIENGSPNDVSEVFENFKRSLTVPEVDFLTSGHRYRLVREVVTDFVKGRYGQFVKDVETDINEWMRTGLSKANQIDGSVESVSEFIEEQRALYGAITRQHYSTIESITMMSNKYLTQTPQGSDNHLQMFQERPSALYPHLDRLWKEINFERLAGEDRKLIDSLEQVHRRYEEVSRRLKSQYGSDAKPSPAVEAMVKLSTTAHRAAIGDIGMLVRVAGFIKQNAHSAYNATVKSFSYIIRILTIVSKSSGVDADRIKKSLEVMQRKRKELNDILQLG